ncbi:MAG TPA: carboxypeptidase regulatory-like domain-containing protein, partial [Pyrinomonadaceae bacterium]
GQSGRAPQQQKRPEQSRQQQSQQEAAPGQSADGGKLDGQVLDQFGGLIVGATVTVKGARGAERTAVTDSQGRYSFKGLAPGLYAVRVNAQGFADYEQAGVRVEGGRAGNLQVRLEVPIQKQEVTVVSEGPVGNSLSGLVLRGRDLDALPIGPGGLEATLRALAVPSTGPFGPEIIVNGFPGGVLPPKSSIREIRINQNPFSAEYARLGFGRVEILTKPGTDALHVGTFFNFNDESLNSRNPFAPDRAPYQSRHFGGSLSGSIINKRASFFLDFERYRADNNAVVNATVLSPELQVTPFNQAVVTPQRRVTFSPRLEFQLDKSNTLVARYTNFQNNLRNSEAGGFSLQSRALTSSERSQTFQLTETAILNPSTLNELRFQFVRNSRTSRGDNSLPALSVPEAFVGGGAQSGLTSSVQAEWQLQNYTLFSFGSHFLKVGEQVRGVRLSSSTDQNFNGTFTFYGGVAPQLDASGQVVRDSSGNPVLSPITGIERYRRTLLFGKQGLSAAEARALGGGASQFSVAAGDAEAKVSQYEAGVFVQDDWRLRPNLSLSLGLRYELQSNVHGWLNFAPRVGVAWSPDGNSKSPKTMLRGGVGVFFDRFNENYALAARRYNGLSQHQYVVSDPSVLDLFPNLPSPETLVAYLAPQAIRRIAENLSAPYSIQSSFTFERQLPAGFTLATTLIDTRSLHLLRSRNVNAPYAAGSGLAPARPYGNVGEIYQYESSGSFDQQQLAVNLVSRFRSTMTLWATYVLNRAKGDTDGAESFPSYSYNLADEYGRSASDFRHSFYLGGWIAAPGGININPLLFYRSGAPFNITVGRDTNGDSLFTERPAFAADLTRPQVVVTPYGAFDLDPAPGQPVIPRNYGTGPGYFSANLGLSRTFNFGGESKEKGRAGGAGWFGSRRYSLTLSVQIENVFNHTNPGLPVGNLSSPFFGRSTSSAGAYGFGNNAAGNRRIELQVFLNF